MRIRMRLGMRITQRWVGQDGFSRYNDEDTGEDYTTEGWSRWRRSVTWSASQSHLLIAPANPVAKVWKCQSVKLWNCKSIKDSKLQSLPKEMRFDPAKVRPPNKFWTLFALYTSDDGTWFSSPHSKCSETLLGPIVLYITVKTFIAVHHLSSHKNSLSQKRRGILSALPVLLWHFDPSRMRRHHRNSAI